MRCTIDSGKVPALPLPVWSILGKGLCITSLVGVSWLLEAVLNQISKDVAVEDLPPGRAQDLWDYTHPLGMG